MDALEMYELLLTGVNPFTQLLAFLWGGIWGSFLNVVVYRLPLLRSVVFPPSACWSCGQTLAWYENVPILSCLCLGASCQRCGSTFSWRYMFVEIWMAGWCVFLLSHDRGLGVTWLFHTALIFLATAVFLTDYDHWIIPDEVNFAGVVVGILFSIFLAPRNDLEALRGVLGPLWQNNVISSLVGVAFGWMFFWAVQVFGMLVARQEAMGGGDVKYGAALGAFLGWYAALQTFLLSFLLGAVTAIPMMILARSGKQPIPFGTFMSIAAVLVALWGSELMGIFHRFLPY